MAVAFNNDTMQKSFGKRGKWNPAKRQKRPIKLILLAIRRSKLLLQDYEFRDALFAEPVKLEGAIKLPSNKLINLEDQEQVKWKLGGQLGRRDVSFLLRSNIGYTFAVRGYE